MTRVPAQFEAPRAQPPAAGDRAVADRGLRAGKPGVSDRSPPPSAPAADLRARIEAWLAAQRAFPRQLLGELWGQASVLCLGEEHDQRARVDALVAQLVLLWGGRGDAVCVENDAADPRQDAVEQSRRACAKRGVDFVELGESGSDARYFQALTSGLRDVGRRRLLVWAGRAHALWQHPGPQTERLSHRLAAAYGGRPRVRTVLCTVQKVPEFFRVTASESVAVAMPARELAASLVSAPGPLAEARLVEYSVPVAAAADVFVVLA